jgi:hypothetical protein
MGTTVSIPLFLYHKMEALAVRLIGTQSKNMGKGLNRSLLYILMSMVAKLTFLVQPLIERVTIAVCVPFSPPPLNG